MLRICVSRRAFSFMTNSSCSRTCSVRNSTHPLKGVLQFQSLSTSLLLKLIDTIVERFHFEFLLHQSRSRLSEQVISISLKKKDFATFAGLASLKTDSIPLTTSTGCSLSPILSDVRAMPQVSRCRRSSDFEMNLTSNLIFQSDKFCDRSALSIESWVEDENDWLCGLENLSSISGI